MKKISILRLLIIYAAYTLVANFAHPVEPTFYKELNLPDFIFGVAFASMATAIFLFSPFFNKIADRIGPNRLLSISYIGYGFGQLYFFFFARSVLEVVLARFFAGIFIGALGVSHILYILENAEPEARGGSLAAMATISAIFAAFGYMVGGIIGDFSMRLCLGLEVAGLWLLSPLHILFLQDKERQAKKEDLKQLLKEANPLKSFILPKKDLSRAFICFLMVCALTSFASICYEQCFNYFIKDQYGFPPSYNGYLKGGVGIITLIANSTICTYLLNKTDIRISIIYVLTICMFMMIGIVLIDTVVPFIVLNVVFFGFNAVYKPLLQSMLNGFVRRSDAPIVGVYNSISSIGTISGSLVSGFVYEVSPRGSFVYAAVSFGLAIICAIIQQKDSSNCEV
jgi:DHA1 family multidrug resistance protein-like MFS transporter